MPEGTSNNISTKSKGRPNAILRYSGLATQMMAIILAGVFCGMWLDGHFATPAPYFTGGLTVLGVFISMYAAIKGLLKGGDSSAYQKKSPPDSTPDV